MKTIIIYSVLLFLLTSQLHAQCTLSTGTYTQAGITSCLSGCTDGCTLIIPDGAVVDLSGDWDLTGIENLTLDIQGEDSQLNFDNSNEDVRLSETSIFKINKNNTDGLTANNGGNKRIFIGDFEYKGNDFDEIIAAGGVDANGLLLPIVLGVFKALSDASNVTLEWETISEENFDFFSIERSEDGENFYEIGTVPGNGNSTERIQYSYVDNNPVFGTSFYRLNAIDYDGTYEKFQSISIEFLPNELNVSLYPNPGNGKDMRIQLGLPVEAKLKTVSIYNFSGDLIVSKELKVGNNNLNFERQLPKGLYYAKIQIDNYFLSKKLVIN